jgi:hypothetical protein
MMLKRREKGSIGNDERGEIVQGQFSRSAMDREETLITGPHIL